MRNRYVIIYQFTFYTVKATQVYQILKILLHINYDSKPHQKFYEPIFAVLGDWQCHKQTHKTSSKYAATFLGASVSLSLYTKTYRILQ